MLLVEQEKKQPIQGLSLPLVVVDLVKGVIGMNEIPGVAGKVSEMASRGTEVVLQMK